MILPFKKQSQNLLSKAACLVVGMLFGAALSAAGVVGLYQTHPRLEFQRVVDVYDGDTIKVDFLCNEPLVCTSMPIRLRGVDTPEIRGECQAEKAAAIAARNFTKRVLNEGTITISNMDRGKYFRIVADVYVDGSSLAQMLIDAGHGRAYDGGRRLSWCS